MSHLIPGCEDYELGQPVTLKRYSATFRCCLTLQDGEIIFKYKDENTLNIIAGIEIDASLDSSIAALELIFDSEQPNTSGNTEDISGMIQSSQPIVIKNVDHQKTGNYSKRKCY